MGSAIENAPVAQLDRVPDYESGGSKFESWRVYYCRIFIDVICARSLPTLNLLLGSSGGVDASAGELNCPESIRDDFGSEN